MEESEYLDIILCGGMVVGNFLVYALLSHDYDMTCYNNVACTHATFVKIKKECFSNRQKKLTYGNTSKKIGKVIKANGCGMVLVRSHY